MNNYIQWVLKLTKVLKFYNIKWASIQTDKKWNQNRKMSSSEVYVSEKTACSILQQRYTNYRGFHIGSEVLPHVRRKMLGVRHERPR